MVITSEQRSLYEDWQLRRERLLHAEHADDQYRQMQIQLLDYLLRRYRDAPDAQAPARFPLPMEVTFNGRAVLVHHHLWPGRVSSTKSIFDVKQRVATIVNRMYGPMPLVDEELSSEPIDDSRGAHENESLQAELSRSFRSKLSKFVGRMRRIPDIVMEPMMVAVDRLFQGRRSRVRNKKLRQQFKRLTDPKTTDHFLVGKALASGHPNLNRYAMRAWIERVKAGACDLVADRLFSVFNTARDINLDPIRTMLADANPAARIKAMEAIGELGTLDDVSLLSDLMALPDQGDEVAGERATLRMAVQRLVSKSRP